MKRRVVCFLLAAFLLLGLIPATAVTANAASNLTTSEKAIELLKKFEGFSMYAKWDYAQWSIGYGSRCEEGEYPNGITKDEADTLLRKELVGIEAALNSFADTHKLTFKQNQFDALILFSYNNGTGWMARPAEGEHAYFRQSVIDGDTGNTFIYNICLWANVNEGGEMTPVPGLLTRRLCEAAMYLDGTYTLTPPDNYNYVIFDSRGGVQAPLAQDRMQGYDSNELVAIKPYAVKEGYRFLGWYTPVNGGRWITMLDESIHGQTLYAYWQRGDGEVDKNGNVIGVSVNYTWSASNLPNLNVYSEPKASSKVMTTLKKSDTITMVQDYVDASGMKWGKLNSGYWVQLGSPVPSKPIAPQPLPQVTVTNAYVNVRASATANSDLAGKLYLGDKVDLIRVTNVNGEYWGKCSLGWVALKYTDYDPNSTGSDESMGEPMATGVVTANNYLNVRSGAGTNYALTGKLLPGDQVNIYSIKSVNGHEWGRISQGWVCLDYVKYQLVEEDEPTIPTDPEDTTKPSDPTEPSEPSEPEEEDPNVRQGIVTCANVLRIREKAGIEHKQVGYLPNGTKIKIYETTVVKGVTWGRIDEGWVSLDYVKVLPSKEELDNAKIGYITCNNVVNIRSGPGTNNMLVTTLPTGTEVLVFEQTKVNGIGWARIEQGWVCMLYLTLTNETPDATDPTTPTTPTTPDVTPNPGDPVQPTPKVSYTGKVINANSVRVRSGAGLNYAEVASVALNTKLVITEVTLVNGVGWGKIDKGWICLNYVALDPTVNNVQGTVDGVVVSPKIPLNVRQNPGAQYQKVGELANGSKVKVHEIKMVGATAWGRVDNGWVSMTYIQLKVPTSGAVVNPNPGDKPDTPDVDTPDVDDPDVIATGVVINTNALRVRVKPGVSNAEVTRLTMGTPVKIYEEKTVDNALWGRIEQGWVSMAYIQKDRAPAENEQAMTGVVVVNDTPLNVRTGPGTNYMKITTLANGTAVTVYRTVLNGTESWGEIDQGWVAMRYVKITGVKPTDPTEPDATEPKPTDPKPTEPSDPTEPTEPKPTEPEDVTELKIIVEADGFAELEKYVNLKKLDLSGSTCYAEILAYMEAHPEIEVIYTVDLGGSTAVNKVTLLELLPDEFTADTLIENLKYLPNVNTLKLRKMELDLTKVDELIAAYPDIHITYTVDICGSEVDAEAESAIISTITEAKVEEAVERMNKVPGLKHVNLMNGSNTSLSMQGVKTLQTLRPDLELEYTFDFYGKKVSLDTKEVKIEGRTIGDSGESKIRLALDIMTGCEYMLLDDCGIDYEILADIRADYAGKTKVVWRVEYGTARRPRTALTDITVLRFVGNEYDNADKLHNADVVNFKYFNEVKYMDLGHNTTLTNIDFISYMPKLEMAILSAVNMTNLNAFANNPSINFIEVAWCSNLSDISALATCPSMKYLNIAHTKVTDISSISGVDLELFMLYGTKVSDAQCDAYMAAHPDVLLTKYKPAGAGSNPEYGYGWRYSNPQCTVKSKPYSILWDVFDYGSYWG